MNAINKITKLAHLTSVHPRDDIRIFIKECCSLTRHGYDVSLIVADGFGNDICEGIKVLDVGKFKGRLDRVVRGSRRLWHQASVLDADVYHLHDPELLPVGLKLKQKGKRVVFDSHEDVPKQILGKHYLNPTMRRLLSLGFAHYESFVCARLNGIVGATPFIRDKFSKINPRSVNINNFPILGELDAQVPWPNKTNEICYVGTISEGRGIKEMVRAMELTTSRTRLNLVGTFAEPEVEAEVRTYAGWANINALGFQDRRGVAEVIGRSVAGLVTLHPLINYLDALPIKMFEYMSAGIPVIASNFELWRKIVQDTGCGLCVDPMLPATIASAIDYLVCNPNVAKKMGENGRKAVLSHYNWAQEETKLLDFYKEILSA